VTQPTSPIELNGHASRWGEPLSLPDELVQALSAICPTSVEPDDVAEASRDWWPLAMHWSLAGEVPRRGAAVCRPQRPEQVADVMRCCHEDATPVTAAGGRSGVCGASVPLYGGVVLDLSDLQGVEAVDAVSGVVQVLAGTFGPDLEAAIAPHRLTVGHFPQSFDISTVGGWVACLGAGQFSTRYGKIDQMVVGLEVVLADGTTVRTGGAPAAAAGPDLTRLFLGSEGTLGIVTRVWLRAHPLPEHTDRNAWSFNTLSSGIEACRQILRRGATPAVLRLYDAVESQRGHDGDGSECVLLVLDQGDPAIVAATMSVVASACQANGATSRDPALVDRWMAHRNDTNALQALTRKGFVVDTMEIAGPWAALDGIVAAATAALLAVPGTRAASCHLSHSYLDGACLYFTFAATTPGRTLDEIEHTYVELWDAGQRAVLAAGGNLSHHHGVGINRARFMNQALGPAMELLASIKQALDPSGMLNPGKLGLPGPTAEDVHWP
jgi:alkyldihydroxyacetonephosphate synthase